MPDDLLRFVFGPSPYAASWLWLGLALVAIVIMWYVGVVVWTLPAERLRNIPGVRSLHAKLLRRKFVSTIRVHRGNSTARVTCRPRRPAPN